MLAKIAGDAQLAAVGIGDPFAKHRSRPLAEHIEDFRTLLDCGRRHLSVYFAVKPVAHVRAICEGCRFSPISAICTPSAVVEFLADLRQPRPCPRL